MASGNVLTKVSEMVFEIFEYLSLGHVVWIILQISQPPPVLFPIYNLYRMHLVPLNP
jgi:hypothetical protein